MKDQLKDLLIDKYFLKIKDYKDMSFINFTNNKSHYSESFFEEYKRFPNLQFDSFTKLKINEERLYKNSQWKKENLKNMRVLEIGSGAGKFTEILIKSDCFLITTDSSDAININYKNNQNNKNHVCFIKTTANENIFNFEVFDFIVLYGVLQNVDDQEIIIKNCLSLLKKGGQLTLDVTKGKKFNLHLVNPKYFWRIISKRMDPKKLFKIVNFLVPKMMVIDTFFKKKFGFIGRILAKIVFPFPLINYFFLPVNDDTKLKMSILDTFDALASRFDKPLTEKELERMIKKIDKERKTKLEKVKIFNSENLIVANIKI